MKKKGNNVTYNVVVTLHTIPDEDGDSWTPAQSQVRRDIRGAMMMYDESYHGPTVVVRSAHSK